MKESVTHDTFEAEQLNERLDKDLADLDNRIAGKWTRHAKLLKQAEECEEIIDELAAKKKTLLEEKNKQVEKQFEA